jgi:predicted peptidase
MTEGVLRPESLPLDGTRKEWMRYFVAVPDGYSQREQWPLLLFLHGAGERGDDLEAVKRHGPPKLVGAGKKFPFILIAPQCPAGAVWTAPALFSLLDHVAATHHVDRLRVCVTGLSLGGYGTWLLGTSDPGRFAALAPICGWGDTTAVDGLHDVPVWAFHGRKDLVVPFARGMAMVQALNAAGGNARMTEYPEAGHDSWTETYDNPEFYEWLLNPRR